MPTYIGYVKYVILNRRYYVQYDYNMKNKHSQKVLTDVTRFKFTLKNPKAVIWSNSDTDI